MSILKELYNGNIAPAEKFIKNGGEYQSINKQFVEYIDIFSPLLNSNQEELFKKIMDSCYHLNDIEQQESFIRGFRLGAQIMLEIMLYKSENFEQAFV